MAQNLKRGTVPHPPQLKAAQTDPDVAQQIKNRENPLYRNLSAPGFNMQAIRDVKRRVHEDHREDPRLEQILKAMKDIDRRHNSLAHHYKEFSS